jgi:DNA relaxase NicK
MKEVLYSIHWLNVTVHGSKDDSVILYDHLFRDKFGDLQDLGHGGRGFKVIKRGLAEFKLYSEPLLNNGEYFHLEFPGLACEALNWDYFKALYDYLDGNFPEKYKFTRLDLAFDHVNFTPKQAEEEIKNKNIRSLAKRETLEIFETPFRTKDNGELGTKTVQFGSRSSQRMIRIYDKRGFTRLEFEVKQERSDLIAKDLLKEPEDSKWFEISVGHLRDFIDFYTDWWKDFIQGRARANQTLTEPGQVSLDKMTHWIGKQVTPALSVLADVLPYGDLNQMIAFGRKRRGNKYDLIIENAGRFPGRVPTMRKGSQEGPSISQEDQI